MFQVFFILLILLIQKITNMKILLIIIDLEIPYLNR